MIKRKSLTKHKAKAVVKCYRSPNFVCKTAVNWYNKKYGAV